MYYISILFQLQNQQEALKAAFTYYIRHLDDEVAKTNLEYYIEITKENVENIINREAHVSFYLFNAFFKAHKKLISRST